MGLRNASLLLLSFVASNSWANASITPSWGSLWGYYAQHSLTRTLDPHIYASRDTLAWKYCKKKEGLRYVEEITNVFYSQDRLNSNGRLQYNQVTCEFLDNRGEIHTLDVGHVARYIKSLCPAGYVANANASKCVVKSTLVKDQSCPVGNGTNPILNLEKVKTQIENDYVAIAEPRFNFRRIYNSKTAQQITKVTSRLGAAGGGQVIADSIGNPIVLTGLYSTKDSADLPVVLPAQGRGMPPGWHPEFDTYLTVENGWAVVNFADGRTVYFEYESDLGDWVSESVRYSLEYLPSAGNQWRLNTAERTLYFAEGRIVKAEWPDQYAINYVRQEGELTEFSDTQGRSISLVYDDNYISGFIDPSGERYQYEYLSGRLAKVAYPDETTLEYTYGLTDELGDNSLFPYLLTKRTSSIEGVATWGYDEAGNPLSSQSLGVSRQISYGDEITSSGSITRTDVISGPNGEQRAYVYRGQNHADLRVSEVVGGSCEACGPSYAEYQYDDNGHIRALVDHVGNVTQSTNDAKGRPLIRVQGQGAQEAVQTDVVWHERYDIPLRVTTADTQIEYEYLAGNLLSKLTITDLTTAATRTTEFTYTEAGYLSSMDGPLAGSADTTYYHYQANGFLTKIVNPLGHVVEITAHDTHGNPLVVVDANGTETRLEYDAMQRVVAVTTLGASWGYSYQGGLLRETTLPNGMALRYGYDQYGRLVTVHDLLGNQIAYEYDEAGNINLNEIYDAQGTLAATISRLYNSQGLPAEIAVGNLMPSQLSYDDQGNLIRATDPAGNSITRTYDALNRLATVLSAENELVTQRHHTNGNVESVIDPRTNETRYSYNGFGDLIQISSPDTGVTTYEYDPAGNNIAKTDARNVRVEYDYDLIGRITAARYPNAAENLSYIYDEGEYALGRLSQVVGDDYAMAYRYDAFGNVVEQSQRQNGVDYITQYSYDLAGLVASVTYPSGMVISYQRDEAGQIIAVQSTQEGTSTELASQIQYAPFGSVQNMQLGNGLIESRQYDLAARLTQLDLSENSQKSLSYDLASNIEAIDEFIEPAVSQRYSYDSVGRLLTAAGQYGDFSYSYDEVGNRLSLLAEQLTEYQYAPSSNQLETSTREAQPERYFSLDAAGNTIEVAGPNDQRQTLAYNDDGHLSQYTSPSHSASYRYNHLRQRVSKTVTESGRPETTHYVYDLNGLLIAEANEQGDISKEYVYLNGQPLALFYQTPNPAVENWESITEPYADLPILGWLIRVITQWIEQTSGLSESGMAYYHNDHLGTPQRLADPDQNIVWQAHYTPFGQADVVTNEIENPLRFPGQYFDAESSLHYNWNRYYDPSLGRYITSDPIGLLGGLNTYAYAGSNPVMYTDPLGLCPWCVVGAAIGGGLNLYSQYQANGGVNNINWVSVAASAAVGALGGGLGTVASRLTWHAADGARRLSTAGQIAVNGFGNGAIGAGVTVVQNKLTGSCNGVLNAALSGLVAGGFGTGVGAAVSNGLSALNRGYYNSLPLNTRLLLGSNALAGVGRPVLVPGISTISNATSNTVSNLPIYQNGVQNP